MPYMLAYTGNGLWMLQAWSWQLLITVTLWTIYNNGASNNVTWASPNKGIWHNLHACHRFCFLSPIWLVYCRCQTRTTYLRDFNSCLLGFFFFSVEADVSIYVPFSLQLCFHLQVLLPVPIEPCLLHFNVLSLNQYACIRSTQTLSL